MYPCWAGSSFESKKGVYFMIIENLCVRCGCKRSEHDTNLVLESEAFWQEIGAEVLESGYEMDLLTCTDTPRPLEYQILIAENFFSLGNGAGYVSPDPFEENRFRQESLMMSVGGSVVVISMYRGRSVVFDAGL